MFKPHPCRRIAALLLAAVLLSGCVPRQILSKIAASQGKAAKYTPVLYQEQTLSQIQECYSAQHDIVRPHTDAPVIAAWLPYMLYDTLFGSQDMETCRSTVHSYLAAAKAIGINTIFAHACAFGEAYYDSDLMPRANLNCQFDVFGMISEECRSLGISLHAWLNPLRLETAEHMDKYWTGDALSERWYQDEKMRNRCLIKWENRWYFSPSEEAVQDYLCRVAAELLNRYPIDGIHIDDYFYPTISTAFDAEQFSESKADNLAQWRRSQISTLVHKLCETVHNVANDAIFSISPQASIKNNHNKLFADVSLWCAEEGYCDWLIPQLYYGFENDSMPFSGLLTEWCLLPRDASVKLLIGIATYKVGQVDTYAGNGANEWVNTQGIPAKETATVLANTNCGGVAFYHLGTTLSMSDGEKSELSDAIL
ncbi:MAG: family 10 glycosylhydrolase [Oscillospiraceae bacterium]|nr:family 10 glycosylhydrolase [Oscillospiraceae bacterium]